MSPPGDKWRRYNSTKETPLTLALEIFKQMKGRAPNPSELDYIFYALGGTTTRPAEIAVGIRGGLPGNVLTQNREAQRIIAMIENIVESVAYQYGYILDPSAKRIGVAEGPSAEITRLEALRKELWPDRFEGRTFYGGTTQPSPTEVQIDQIDVQLQQLRQQQQQITQVGPEVISNAEGVRQFFRDEYQFSPTEEGGKRSLFPTYKELTVGGRPEDRLSMSPGLEKHYSGEALLYEDFYSVMAAQMEGEPTPGQVNQLRHYFWRHILGDEVGNYSEITRELSTMFTTGSAIPALIVENGFTTLQNIDEYAAEEFAQNYDAASGVTGKQSLMNPGVAIFKKTGSGPWVWNQESGTYVGQGGEEKEARISLSEYYRRIYEDDGSGAYQMDIVQLENLEGMDGISVKFPGRANVSHKVFLVLKERMPNHFLEVDEAGDFHQGRLQAAIMQALRTHVENGEIPVTALSHTMAGAHFKNISTYISDMMLLEPTLRRMDVYDAVEHLMTGIATVVRAHEEASIWGRSPISAALHEKINEMAARDLPTDEFPAGQHAAAIQNLRDQIPYMVDDILLAKQSHNELQGSYAKAYGATRVPFDLETAISDELETTWKPLLNKSVASVEEQIQENAQAKRDIQDANTAAVSFLTEETHPGITAFMEYAKVAWAHQGKDPNEFNASILKRLRNVGSLLEGSTEQAQSSLSRELFDAGLLGTTNAQGVLDPSALQIKLRGLGEAREVTRKGLGVLSGFSTVEAAIASPIGRAALESMAPGLTPADRDAIEGLEAAIGLVASDPASAAELGTVDELKAQIAEIEAAPAARFKQQLDDRATGMPQPGPGYDTGGVDISVEAETIARAEKEKMRTALDVEALMAGVEEWQKDDVYKFLTEEGGLEMLRGQYEAGFAEPDAAYYSQVAKAREAAGLTGVDTDEPLSERATPYVDPYPEYTEPGTYEVEPGKTVTIPAEGKAPQPVGEELEPGEYSRRTLFAQAEAAERQSSMERRKARGETFQKFMITSLPEQMRLRAARIAEFKGSKLVRGTATTGRQRVRF